MGLKSDPLDLSSFSALTLLVWSFDTEKPVPDMTYNVFGGTLNLALFIILCFSVYPTMLELAIANGRQSIRLSVCPSH